MQSKPFFVVLFFGLLSLVAASNIQKRSFKVDRIANAKFTGHNGPRALAKTYRKFGMPLPQGLVDALNSQKDNKVARSTTKARNPIDRRRLSINAVPGHVVDGWQGGEPVRALEAEAAAAGNGTGNQTGLVVTTPEANDVEYLSPVNIGGQTLNLDFDTGSSDLWVFNTQLDPAATAGHSTFDPTKSKTFSVLQDAQFRIQYGDGSGAEGNVGTDNVDIGGASFPAQAVELATAVTDTFIKDQNNDGLLGLAFSSINTVKPQKQKTFFDNVMPSLAEPLFTADLRKNAAGAYEFGRIDTSKFKGNMAWIPVNNTNGFWQFSSEKFSVNGGKAHATTAGGQAIADTGTTLILADPIAVNGYYAKVKGAKNSQAAGGFVVPCNAKLPDLQLDVGGVYMANIKGDDINFAPVGDGTCFGGVQATAAGSLGVYGDIFFKSQFVAFNGGNNSLGMAEHI